MPPSLRLPLLAALLVLTAFRPAAAADPAGQVLRLDGGGVTYAVLVTPRGALRGLYWGAQVAASDALPVPAHQDAPSSHDPDWAQSGEEFPGWGGGLLDEPALKLSFPDGNRDLVLRVTGQQAEAGHLSIRLRDISRPVEVTLDYRLDAATGILGRSASIRNAGKLPLHLDQALSAAWTLPAGEGTRLRYLTGRWGAEFGLQERPVDEAPTTLESRRGVSGHAVNPWFELGSAGTTEEQGPVWMGALDWSGSWRISLARNVFGEVRVAGGFNPFDFGFDLAPGAVLDTPVFYAGFSQAGWGGASRRMHEFIRNRVLPQAPSPKLRPVVYNSWEATEFTFDERSQMAIAEKAARIGVERFVMDDGWFGARDSDRAGLGDWTPNPRKFPHGLKPLIDRVHQLGMSFGLWVEPEMVNPDSALYRAHPDWVIHFPGRPRTEQRNQLVLNLAKPEVRRFVFEMLDRLVSENDIAFLKWDHNRYWSEPGWPDHGAAGQQALYVEYVRNLYAILDELRQRHPALEVEDCAGGGGRTDLGMLGRTDEVWTSDNTDPFDRLAIQDGFSQAYPPLAMVAWVTDSPNWVNGRSTTLDYRFLSSMQGALGIGANLDKWSAADMATASQFIAAYKSVRATVQLGELYRLESPQGRAPRSATLSVTRDRRHAALFVFLHSAVLRAPQPAVHLRGLDPQLRYAVRSLDGKPLPEGLPAAASGAYWMDAGVRLQLEGDHAARGLAFEVTP